MPSAHLRNRLAEVGLDVLVGLLLLDVAVVSPLAELRVVNRHLAEAGVVLILLAGVAALSWRNVLVRLFIVAAVGGIATRLANLVLRLQGHTDLQVKG